MNKKPLAVVAVSKEWMNSGVHLLLDNGKPSESTNNAHLLILSLEDDTDHRGLWLADITTERLTTNGSPVTMRKFLVPWSYIYAVGLIEDSKLKPGFINT